jgi:hypothetical protein
MQFTRISKPHVLLEIHFCTGVPGRFQILTSRSLLALRSRKRIETMQLGPWGRGRRQSSGIPASSSLDLARETAGRSTWSHGCDLGRREGGSGTGRWGATTTGIGGAWRSGSGELSAGAREWVARPALLGPREGVGAIRWRGADVGQRLSCGGAHGAAADSSVARLWHSGRREGKRGLKRFIGELFDLEQSRTEEERPRAGHAQRWAARAGAARPGACTPRDEAWVARIPAVSRRACPPREDCGLGRRGLGRRTVPRGAGVQYRAARALARAARRGRIVFVCPCLNTCNSKKLNRSAQSSE